MHRQGEKCYQEAADHVESTMSVTVLTYVDIDDPHNSSSSLSASEVLRHVATTPTTTAQESALPTAHQHRYLKAVGMT